MASRARTHLRSAAALVAFVALAICAYAAMAPPAHAAPSKKHHAAKKKKAAAKKKKHARKSTDPRITRIAPKKVALGGQLRLFGRNFRVGRAKNTVVFKRAGARAVFVKADLSTRTRLTVTVPASLEKLLLNDGNPQPTSFRLRVLATKLAKHYTSTSLSPVISTPPPKAAPPPPAAPDGDCDGDGIPTSKETDADNDLLSDALELRIRTLPCNPDSDADGVQDGYEYQSAIDLNDDDYQNPNFVLPYPAKRPYPNPLFADATVDYDGDGVIDGADDQDHDDVPNVQELSRRLAAGENQTMAAWTAGADPATIHWNRPLEDALDPPSPADPQPRRAMVDPFNPCLPDIDSRTCARHPIIGSAYPPFDPQWVPLILN
jgi:hypothetical protein